ITPVLNHGPAMNLNLPLMLLEVRTHISHTQSTTNTNTHLTHPPSPLTCARAHTHTHTHTHTHQCGHNSSTKREEGCVVPKKTTLYRLELPTPSQLSSKCFFPPSSCLTHHA